MLFLQVYINLKPDLEHYIDSDSESASDSEAEVPVRPLDMLRSKSLAEVCALNPPFFGQDDVSKF